MPRKPASTPTTPTKAEKRRGGTTGGGVGGTPAHARATAASAARSGSPSSSSSRAMRVAASSSSPSTTNPSGSGGPGRNAGSSTASGAGITAPPRAALGRTSSSPAPDEYRTRAAATVDGSTPVPTVTASTPGGGCGREKKDGAETTARSTTTNPPGFGSGSGSNSTTPLITSRSTDSSSSSNDLHSLLEEKDSRIAHLERELLIMESEFTRELDKLSKSESETSSFWQAKYSSLNQQYLRTDTELRLLRAEVEKQLQSDSSSEQQRDQWDREREEVSSLFRARYENLARELQVRDDEIHDLRIQIRGLKEWVSMSTRSDGTAQTSDEVFGEGMARLGNSLQNWVLVNFRRAKIDLSKADGETLQELGRLVPMYEVLASISKINLIQSLLSRLLIEFVFDAYFVGLSSDQTRQFTQMETFLSSFASSPEAINQWRSMTLSIIKKEADQKLQKETANIISSVILKVNTLLSAITETKPSEARDQALRVLVGSSIELSRLLVIQRAIFKVSMPEILPHQRIMFDPSTMEDIGGEDEESLEDREICCVTFPGIIKRGDESGGHLQYRNIISKARVLCSPE